MAETNDTPTATAPEAIPWVWSPMRHVSGSVHWTKFPVTKTTRDSIMVPYHPEDAERILNGGKAQSRARISLDRAELEAIGATTSRWGSFRPFFYTDKGRARREAEERSGPP